MKLAKLLLASPLVFGLVIAPPLSAPVWSEDQATQEKEGEAKGMPLPIQRQGSQQSPGRVSVLPLPLPEPPNSPNPSLQMQQQRPGQAVQPLQPGQLSPGSGTQVDLPPDPAGRYGATPIEIP